MRRGLAMQTAIRDASGPAVATDRTLPGGDVALVALQGVTLLVVLLGGPVLADSLGGALLAVIVAVALLAALVGLVWRLALEFERAWLNSYTWPLLGHDVGCDSANIVAGDLGAAIVKTRPPRASEHAPLGGTRSPSR
jgi:hypothetical protein